MLDNILKDQGTELGRAMSANNFLSNANTRNNQNAAKIAVGAEQKMNDSASKAQNDMFRQLMDSQKFQVNKDLAEKRGEWLDAQTDRAKKYAPLGQGLPQEMRAAQHLYQLEREGKTEEANALRNEIRTAQVVKALINQGAKGNETTSRTGQTWGVDANGQKVPLETTSTSTKHNPSAPLFAQFAQGILGGGGQNPLIQSRRIPQISPQSLMQAASQSAPETQAPQIVSQAMQRQIGQDTRKAQAAEAINLKLTPHLHLLVQLK